MSPPKSIGLHVRLTPKQAATLDRLIADGGDPEATRSRIVRGLIDAADKRPVNLDALVAMINEGAVLHSCTNAAPCPRCSS